MIYWHVERRSVCIYSQLKSCSSSEVAAMIEGLLRHCTDAEIDSNYVDTHGASLVGFAFTELLGFKLLPRLKNIGSIRLYRPDDTVVYGELGPVLTRQITGGGKVFRSCTIPPLARLSPPVLQRGPRGSRPSRAVRV